MVTIFRRIKVMKPMLPGLSYFHHDSVRDEPTPFPGVATEFTKDLRFILPEEVKMC